MNVTMAACAGATEVYCHVKSAGSVGKDHRKDRVMTEIKWESDFASAVQQAGNSKIPLYLDFWFDG